MTRCGASPDRSGAVTLAVIAALVCATLFCAAMLGACSPASRHGNGEYPGAEAQGPTERVWPATESLFRHAVRITLPGTLAPLVVDGIMRLTPGTEGPEIRIVCLGPLGMTLCDMTIGPQESRTDLLHPSLRRVPQLEQNLARCIRSVWLHSLPVTGLAATPRWERREDALLEHRLTPEGDRLTTAFALGRERATPLWSVRFAPGPAHPAAIFFTSYSPEYTVQIRLIAKGERP